MAEGDPVDQQQLDALLRLTTAIDRPVPSRAVSVWSGRLPDVLMQIWNMRGLARIADGRMRLVDPTRYEPLMALLFEGDPDFDGDTHVIALGDMGQLALWSERHGFAFLMPSLLTLETPHLLAAAPPSPDQQIAELLLGLKAEHIETFDPQGEPVHERLRLQLGPLDGEDIYAATPVPPAPGGTEPEDYVLADALEWLEALITESEITLVDWRRRDPTLRLARHAWPKDGVRRVAGGNR